MHNKSDITKNIANKLNSIRNRWKLRRAGQYLVFAAMVFIVMGTVFSLAEGIFWIPVGGRSAMVLALIIGTAVFICRADYYAVSAVLGIRNPSDIKVAEWVGKGIPRISDRLRNALQLQDESDRIGIGESESLKVEALCQIGQEFLDSDTRSIVTFKGLLRILKFAAVSALILPIFLFSFVREGTYRLTHPLMHFEKPLPFTLSIEPGDVTLVEGDTLKLIAHSQGEYPREVAFHIYRGEGIEDEGERHIRRMEADSTYRLELAAVVADFNYKASAGKVESPLYKAAVRKPPLIRNLRVKLIPPAYSELPVMTLEDNVGDFLALAGSKAEICLESRGEIEKAYLVWEGVKGDTIAMRAGAGEAFGELRVFASGSYHIRLQAPDGLLNRSPIEYRVDILPDLPPRVEIVSPGADLEIGGTGLFKFLAEAEDDFGLSRAELKYRLISEFSPDTSDNFQNIQLKYRKDADEIYRIESLLDLTQLDMIPGDVIEYFAEVWDNDKIKGPKSDRSRIFSIRLPTMAEMFAETEQAETQGLKELEEVLEQSGEIKRDIEKTIEEIRRKGELDWSEKRDLAENLKRQKELLDKLEKASEAMEEIMAQAEESSLMSLELLEKYSELQKLLSEIDSPELQKALERLNQTLENANPEELLKSAEEFQQFQEEMLKQLEKSLEILNQLKMERKLEELAQRAAEMAERQLEIAEQLKDAGGENLPELTKKEQYLKKDMEDWLETLSETEELAETRDTTAAGELNEVTEEAEPIPGEMENVSGQMLKQQMQSAQMQAQRTGEKLQRISQRMGEIKEGAVQRMKEELAEEMLAAVQDMAALSKQQEELIRQNENISLRSSRFREGVSAQSSVAEGLKKVTEELFELSQKSYFITPEIGAALGRSAGMMNSALDAFTARNPQGVTIQQQSAMESLNRAAMGVMDALGKMQGSESATGFSELMERLQEMSQKQSGLNQATQSMAMPIPGEGGSPSEQSNVMGQLAAQQRALQRAMEEAAQMAQQVGGVMGDLGNIADAMGEAADSLKDKHVGERTLKLQERILSRLLDAQKSVRTQRVSKQRKSKTGDDVVRRSPEDLPEDMREEMFRRDLIRAMKEGYAPDYQKLIREYFRRMYEKRD